MSLSVDKEQVTCEKEDAEEQLEALRSRMLQLELEKSSLRDQLSAKDSEIEQQARALETLRAAPVVPASSGGLTADEALEQLKAMQSRFDQASEQLDATRRQHAEKIEQSNRDLLGVREELQKVSHTNEQAQREVAKLQKALAEKAAALEKREAEIETWKSEKSKVEENFRMFQANTARTLGEMENLRAALLHDLQNRCEKVVQLEMMLDEERDTARATPNRSSLQQLKGKLKEQEKNLAQITQEYQNLFRRTADLTREVAMYQKQLEGARTRIRDLETINLGLREDVRRIEQSSEQELARVVAQLQSNGASRIRSNSVSQPGVPGAGVSMSTAPTYRGMSKEPHAHISVPKVMRGGGVGAPRPSMSSDGAPDSSVSGMRSPSSGEGSPSASAAASSESTAMPARQMRAPAAAPASSSGVASFFDRLTGFGRSTSAASSAADEQRASRRTASGVLEMSGSGAGAGGGGSGGGGAVQMTSMSLSSNLTAAQFEQAFPTSSVPEKRTPPPPLPPRR